MFPYEIDSVPETLFISGGTLPAKRNVYSEGDVINLVLMADISDCSGNCIVLFMLELK